MKNTSRHFEAMRSIAAHSLRLCAIALAVVIGFSMTACGGDDGNPPGGTGTAPTITTATLPGGTVGTVYSQTLTATGNTPITWSIDTGFLPDGLWLSDTGVISGTPETADTFSFTVKATNAAGNDTKALSIVITTSGGSSCQCNGDYNNCDCDYCDCDICEGTGLYSLAAVEAYLLETTDDPVLLSVNIDFENQNNPFDGNIRFYQLLDRIVGTLYQTGRTVELELDLSTSTGITDFSGQNDGYFGDNNTYFCANIVKIILPNDITTITGGVTGDSIFSELVGLKEVTAPNATTIADTAFSQNRSLESVSFPKVTSIGTSAFYYCDKLESVNFPLATSIGASAFSECASLENAVFPKVTSIGASAFSECDSLESVSFPLATSIGASAFSECDSLESVSFPLATSIGASAFYNCESLTSISFPKATSIGDSSFKNCTSLGSVNGTDVTLIGVSAFFGCVSLESITFPKAEVISKGAFKNCTSLENVSFPLATSILGPNIHYEGNVAIGDLLDDGAFEDCTNLKTVNFPLVTTIGASAFYRCTKLESANFPAVTLIWGAVFENTGATALTITLGAEAPELHEGVFFNVEVAKSVTVKVPQNATGYGSTIPITYSGTYTVYTDIPVTWGSGFRNMGWDGQNYLTCAFILNGNPHLAPDCYLNHHLNRFITLNIAYID